MIDYCWTSSEQYFNYSLKTGLIVGNWRKKISIQVLYPVLQNGPIRVLYVFDTVILLAVSENEYENLLEKFYIRNPDGQISGNVKHCNT